MIFGTDEGQQIIQVFEEIPLMASKLLLVFFCRFWWDWHKKQQQCVTTKLEDKDGHLQKWWISFPSERSIENHRYFFGGKIWKDQEQQITNKSSLSGYRVLEGNFFHGVFPAGSADFAVARDDETWNARQKEEDSLGWVAFEEQMKCETTWAQQNHRQGFSEQFWWPTDICIHLGSRVHRTMD